MNKNKFIDLINSLPDDFTNDLMFQIGGFIIDDNDEENSSIISNRSRFFEKSKNDFRKYWISLLPNNEDFYNSSDCANLYELILSLEKIYTANKSLKKIGFPSLTDDNIINDLINPNSHFIFVKFFY
jgi:hypothetical protein